MEATSWGSYSPHRPPEPLKVLRPLSALTPAPVRTAIFFFDIYRFFTAFRMTLWPLEICVLEPIFKERIEDERAFVVSDEGEDLLLHESVLEPADIGR